MSRQAIYDEIEHTLGLVPSMFKSIPDSALEAEWNLYKRAELEEGPIPNKYRELIGLAIAAATKCRYCTFCHAEVAKLAGATDEEIADALHYAKFTSGWSTYVNGLDLDFDQFKDEVLHACEHMHSMHSAGWR